MFKFAKKLGSSILDSLLGFIFGIVCVVLVAAIIIKTINLGTKHWNRESRGRATRIASLPPSRWWERSATSPCPW